MSLSGLNAHALVARLAEQLPNHTWIRHFRAGVRSPRDGFAGRCPRCNRNLPVYSLYPTTMLLTLGVMSIPRTKEERIHECLVDGPRASRSMGDPLEELFSSIADLGAVLAHSGWRRWSSELQNALAGVGDVNRRAEDVGQCLETLRRFGPIPNSDELDGLVVSLGKYWPVNGGEGSAEAR